MPCTRRWRTSWPVARPRCQRD